MTKVSLWHQIEFNRIHVIRAKELDQIRLDNFVVPMQCTGNWGCFPRGKRAAIIRRYPFFSPFLFPVCFHNPPNSDMDYGIFNVCTFLCVRIYMGVGHTDNESAHFDSEKLTNFLVLQTGFEPLVMESIGSRGRRSTNSATSHQAQHSLRQYSTSCNYS